MPNECMEVILLWVKNYVKYCVCKVVHKLQMPQNAVVLDLDANGYIVGLQVPYLQDNAYVTVNDLQNFGGECSF